MPKRMTRRPRKTGSNNLVLLGGALAGAAAAWIWYSNSRINHAVTLPEAIPAPRESFFSETGGEVSYYADKNGTGRPLVLIHSVNAAASAYEMRPLFMHYRGQRPVYVIDLPGYGFSERADHLYTPQVFAGALIDFLKERVGAPADVIALSLGCEFAARAAFDAPDLIHSLAFISPSGLKLPSEGSHPMQAGDAGMSELLHAFFAFPLWGRPFYDLLTTRASIKYYLQKSFVGEPPPEFIEYDYATAHQPGAEHVPFYFISGALFTKNIARTIYERLTTPTLVIYDRDGYTRFDALPAVLRANSQWRAQRISPTLGLPQFEKLPGTVGALDAFWASIPA